MFQFFCEENEEIESLQSLEVFENTDNKNQIFSQNYWYIGLIKGIKQFFVIVFASLIHMNDLYLWLNDSI